MLVLPLVSKLLMYLWHYKFLLQQLFQVATFLLDR